MARRKQVKSTNLYSDTVRRAFGRSLLSCGLQAQLLRHQILQMAQNNKDVGGMIFSPKEARVLEQAIVDLEHVRRVTEAVGKRAKTRARLEV